MRLTSVRIHSSAWWSVIWHIIYNLSKSSLTRIGDFQPLCFPLSVRRSLLCYVGNLLFAVVGKLGRVNKVCNLCGNKCPTLYSWWWALSVSTLFQITQPLKFQNAHRYHLKTRQNIQHWPCVLPPCKQNLPSPPHTSITISPGSSSLAHGPVSQEFSAAAHYVDATSTPNLHVPKSITQSTTLIAAISNFIFPVSAILLIHVVLDIALIAKSSCRHMLINWSHI